MPSQHAFFKCYCIDSNLFVPGTTIPAGTAVMTGTPAGVGAFRQPKLFLGNGDVVEIEMPKIGVLRNEIQFK